MVKQQPKSCDLETVVMWCGKFSRFRNINLVYNFNFSILISTEADTLVYIQYFFNLPNQLAKQHRNHAPQKNVICNTTRNELWDGHWCIMGQGWMWYICQNDEDTYFSWYRKSLKSIQSTRKTAKTKSCDIDRCHVTKKCLLLRDTKPWDGHWCIMGHR